MSLIDAQFVPPSLTDLVPRQRLVSLMENQMRSPIVLISGEPASGKTSLAVEWIESTGRSRGPVAWLTLRRNLDDPVLFWRYMLAAIEPLGVETGEFARALADGEPPNEEWLTELANRLSRLSAPSTIVLDDFQELASAEALTSLEAFLEMVLGPPHFVILTRSKPPWPLTQWHLSGRLSEIDSLDLRLTVDEARAMIDRAGTEIDDVVVDQLLRRTEGWVGGIRLALMSMHHASDPAEFVARFAADDELVSAYLFREVLEKMDPEIRALLLECSVLDYLTPNICDALRERDDSAELLKQCAEENLFLTRVPGPSDAYQMHALFAQFLSAALGAGAPGRPAELHVHASAVFERAGDIQLAIRHAVEGGDHGRVGLLIVEHGMLHAARGEFDTIRSWLPILRRGRASGAPAVTLALATAMIILGQGSDALALLEEIGDLEDLPAIEYAALQLRALQMLRDGDFERLRIVGAELAAKLPTDPVDLESDALTFEAEGYARYVKGLAAWIDGDLAAARANLESVFDRKTSPLVSVEGSSWLARTVLREGELDLALRYAQESLDRHAEHGGGETAVVVGAYLVQADVAWERNDLERAEELLDKAKRHLRPIWWQMVFVQVSASRLLMSRGAFQDAREQLIACGRTYVTGASSMLLRSQLCDALIDVALRLDDLNDARRWIAVRSTWTDQPLSLPMRLRLTAVRGTTAQVDSLDEVVANEPLPIAIDALLAGATLAIRSGEHRRGRYLVADAARRGEPEGMVRRIIDYSDEVRRAVRDLVSTPPVDATMPPASPFFVSSLVSALDAETIGRPRLTPHSDELVEQLTGRELEVLELLSTSNTYREMGSRLYISRNTVKSHVRHIYTKLGVMNRETAVQEGRRLGLIWHGLVEG